MVGDEQSAKASQKTDADRQPDDFLEAVSEQVGGHLRDGEQRDGQHDTYHTKAGNDGQRNNIISRYSNISTGIFCERANSRSKAIYTIGRMNR